MKTALDHGKVTATTLMWVSARAPGLPSVDVLKSSRDAVALYGRLSDEYAVEGGRVEISWGTGREHSTRRSVFSKGQWV